MRVSLSPAASEKLSVKRFRRLLSIELDEAGQVASGTGGPLGNHVAYVYVDVPSASHVLIETRVGSKPVARRLLDLAGFRWNIAGRLVALTASEMLRAQLRPARPRRPKRPKGPTPEELERASRARPATLWSGGVSGAWVPSEGALLAGPAVSAAFRSGPLTQRVFGRWLGSSSSSFGTIRWLEAGLQAETTLWLGPAARFTLGADAAAAAVRLGNTSAVDGIAGQRETWSARAGADLGFQARVAPPAWLALGFQPGAILRSVPYQTQEGRGDSVKGFWLGLSLSLLVDHPI